METLIIDVSTATFRDYIARYGRMEGLIHACWYRIARPALVLAMWVLFALYVYHSLVTVGGTAAQIADLVVYVSVVAAMAAGLVSWMIICGFHNWIRMRDVQAATAPFRGLTPHELPRWASPDGARLLLVHHDASGGILRVDAWRERSAAPNEPFFYVSEPAA